MSGAMPFLVKSRVLMASSTRRPLIRSSTRRAFCGETRTYLAAAVNSMSLSLPCRRRRRGLGRGFRGRFHRVSLELAGEAELAQLVTDHVLRDVHRDELLAVVHRDGMAH